MGYWLLAAAAVSLLSSYSSDQKNAASTLRQAKANSDALLKTGKYNAASIMALGQLNMAMNLGMGNIETSIIRKKAEYNAGLRSMIGDYNATLLEDEARLVWEKADLDVEQLEEQYSVAEGKMQVGFGASGVIMNQDSPQDAIIDLRTSKALDTLIVRHGADIEAGKILDSAARSRWEGNLAAHQIITEGKLDIFGTYGSRYLNAVGAGAQAAINANSTMYNAEVSSWQTLTSGQISSTNQQNQATSNLVSGLFSAAANTYSSNLSNSTITSNYDIGSKYSGMGSLNYSPSISQNSSPSWYGSYVRRNSGANEYTQPIF